MDYNKIKIPYLDKERIKTKADLFRKNFWNDSIPIDIEKIIDFRLKIDIVPLQDLFNRCDTDALITSDWKLIYIDSEKYLDDRWQNRLRFSLSHEIGHFVLHKKIYGSFKIEEIRDFYSFIEDMPVEQYGYFETQANKFANYLLVPREILLLEKEKVLKKYKNLENIDIKILNSYLATPLSNFFGVSPEVVEIALNEIEKSQD